MLISRATGKITHHHITDLPDLLPKGSLIVANNTKVFPARLLGHKETGGKVELLLTTPLGHSRYRCLTRPGLGVGDQVVISDIFKGKVTYARPTEMERIIAFDCDEASLRELISQHGSMPTPPYIKKMLDNNLDYQTIYAKYGFSAAAPTAGLHFTERLLRLIKSVYPWHELTLNVGLGTFLPVKEESVTTHHMHSEKFTINTTTAAAINEHHAGGGKVLAVGTTTLRALESSVNDNDDIISQSKSTDIFIYPPYRIRSADMLMTNFHLPKSTLLMLVSAFASSPNTEKDFTTFGDSLIGRAYREAVAMEYRFFSFGDAMLII
jgi:S-adenosylmethionine:tRNA ribosyltransferase-isomerase